MRDIESKKRLKRLGIKKKIHVIPDMAFRRNKNHSSEKENKKRMVVALRQIQGLSESFQKEIANFINWLVEYQKWTVDFINFQEGEESDKIIHKKIQDLIKNKSQIRNSSNLEDIGKADLLLGMRLHSIISSIKAKTPFIAISYAPKVKSLLKAINLNNYTAEMDEIKVQKFKDLFIKIEKDQEKISQKLEQYNKKAIREHEEIEEILKVKITSHSESQYA